MEDRETARMRKYGESKTTRIMMATVSHVTSGLGLRKFQAHEFLLTRVYITPLATRQSHARDELRENVDFTCNSYNSKLIKIVD